jgi:hypothetical protein
MSSLDLYVIKYVLRSCDITNLESFGLYYPKERVLDKMNSLRLMKQGFPAEVAYVIERVNKSRNYLMGRMVDVLIRGDNRKIQKLYLDVDLRLPNIDWMLRLLQSTPCLEEFHLRGLFVWGTDVEHQRENSNLYNILAVIEGLPRLKTLELIDVQCSHSVMREKISMKLVSHSLENVSLYQSYFCGIVRNVFVPTSKYCASPSLMNIHFMSPPSWREIFHMGCKSKNCVM